MASSRAKTSAPKGVPAKMASIKCKCGEYLHYTAEQVGFVAKCRCGRGVQLPSMPMEPLPPAPKSHAELEDEYYRKRNIKWQIAAVGLFFLLVCAGVGMVAMKSGKHSPGVSEVGGDPG
ncbi:MAG: hypothetical protein JWM95_2196 [Gemmatimonadetes bacterium]|nr:hypothetical protein [Gemmatimonadota bacterium]